MRYFFLVLLASLSYLIASTASAATIEGYVGHSATQVAYGMTVKLVDVASGEVIATDSTNFFGKYKFKQVSPGQYRLEVGEFQRELRVSDKNPKQRIDIDLSAEGGFMDYSKAGTTSGKAGVSDTAAGNNTSLQQQIAGTWWGYAGSTERRIGLCPDGSYQDYTESGYSGRMYDSGGYQTGAWGAASQGGGSGNWTIQGDTQSGVINVHYNDGGTAALNYRQIGDPGCLNINGNTLCRESANCR